MGFLPEQYAMNSHERPQSKAAWLKRLGENARLSIVDEFLVFSCSEWNADRSGVINRISERFREKPALIVRSSVNGEDGPGHSLAGVFRSEVLSEGSSEADISSAIEVVIQSYQTYSHDTATDDEVIIQKYVSSAVMAGVVITHDVWDDRPYYLVNYDDGSGRTDTVTSGISMQTCRFPRGEHQFEEPPQRWRALLAAVAEIESIFPASVLDIEFAVTGDGDVHVFQVRELSRLAGTLRTRGRFGDLAGHLTFLRGELRKKLNTSSGLPGASTVLADMADWNPAEILGADPKPLDISLYSALVTDSAWGAARRSMGYSDVGRCRLMLLLGRKPYIDLRVSLISLTPASVPTNIRAAVVDSGVERLCSEPSLQDKIEFEIALSSVDFGTERRLSDRLGNRLSREQLAILLSSLRVLTNDMIAGAIKAIESDVRRIKRLRSGDYSAPETIGCDQLGAYVGRAIEECVTYGTVPFSRLARLAFVGLAFLRSAKDQSLLSDDDCAQFLAGLQTVATGFASACEEVGVGSLSHAEFIRQYGHLRPRMYDILSLPYSEYGVEFWSGLCKGDADNSSTVDEQMEVLTSLDPELTRMGMSFRGVDLGQFIKAAIEAREWAKFCFSRCVSALLETVASVGTQLQISREELAFLTVEDIVSVPKHAPKSMIRDHLLGAASMRRQHWDDLRLVAMPSVVRGVSDLVYPLDHAPRPTFITQKRVQAEILHVCDPRAIEPGSVMGRIVLLEAADPGFDWVFAHRPAGLITRYGGAGSHMAIRCGEFGVPGAIGCGESAFKRLVTMNKALLDCSAGRIVADDCFQETSV